MEERSFACGKPQQPTFSYSQQSSHWLPQPSTAPTPTHVHVHSASLWSLFRNAARLVWGPNHWKAHLAMTEILQHRRVLLGARSGRLLLQKASVDHVLRGGEHRLSLNTREHANILHLACVTRRAWAAWQAGLDSFRWNLCSEWDKHPACEGWRFSPYTTSNAGPPTEPVMPLTSGNETFIQHIFAP